MPVKCESNLTLITLTVLFGLSSLLPTIQNPYAWCNEPDSKVSDPTAQPPSEQVTRLLDEVRGLRQDVKKLSELVEQRLTATSTDPAEQPIGLSLTSPDIRQSPFLSTTVILFFSAKWCGPCQKMLPVIQELKREGWPIQIVDIDIDKKLASDFNVLSIPHVAIASDRKELDHITGLTNEAQLIKLFEKYSIHRQAAQPEFTLYDKFERVDPDSRSVVIDEVRVEGNSTIPESEITKYIRVRPGLMSSFRQIKDDVEKLVETRWFASVEPIIQRKEKEEENILIYRVVERPLVSRVEYKGLKKVPQKVFDTITQLKPGRPFDVSANRECCRRIEEYYHEKGFLFATVKLEKGMDRDDREVVFLVREGPKVHVTSVKNDNNEEQLNITLTEAEPSHSKQQKDAEATRKPAAAEQPVDNSKQDEKKQSRPLVICYQVADLVVPREGQLGAEANSTIRGTLDLIDRIKDEVQPESWIERGGDCTLGMNEATLSFVVRAPMETHDQIQALLERIRRDRGELIQYETVIFEFKDAEGFQLGSEKFIDLFTVGQGRTLNEKAFGELQAYVETAGGKIRYIPKITSVYGAIPEAHFSANSGQPSEKKLHLYMRGVLTADRKDFRLSVVTDPNRLLYDFATRQHRVAEGQTLLIDMSPSANPDPSKDKVLVAIRPRRVKEEEGTAPANPATDQANPQK